MVEMARDEGEAMAMNGPRQQEGGGGAGDMAAAVAVAGEKEKRDGEEGEERKEEINEGEKVDEEEAMEEEEEEWSEIRLAIAALSSPPVIRGGGGGGGKLYSSPPTLPFLALSHLLLQVLDKIGPTMAVLRLDVQRNIERLQELYVLDPSKYSTLTAIVEKESEEGTSKKVDSRARSILWLTRSMDFTVALLQTLQEDEGSCDQQSLAQLVEVAYDVSLKQWHGWISSAAYKIAMKLIPEKKIFVASLVGKGQDCSALKDDIEGLIRLLQPFLDDIHAMLAKFRLDRLKST